MSEREKAIGMAQETDDGGWEVVFTFDDPSPSFCDGFEAGQLWAKMGLWMPVIEQVITEGRLAFTRRMADHHGYRLEHTEPEDGWISVRLTKA